MQPIVELLPCFENVVDADTQTWLESDELDKGYQILSDDEIIYNIQNQNLDIIYEDISDSEENNQETKVPTNAEAFDALEVAMAWLEVQPSTTITELLQLKKIRDKAAFKRTSNIKQKNIENYFSA